MAIDFKLLPFRYKSVKNYYFVLKINLSMKPIGEPIETYISYDSLKRQFLTIIKVTREVV